MSLLPRVCTSRGILSTALVASVLIGLGAAAGCATGPEIVRIVGAASMRGVLDELARDWEADRPGVRVTVETGGSTALARRLVELDADADLVVLADTALFTELLRPTWTRFHVGFAVDRIVLAYSATSRGRDALDHDGRWPAVLARDDVRIAIADPDLAPAGYRTLQALQLFDLENPGADVEALVRAKVGRRFLVRDVAELLAPLQAGAVDFAFLYASTARAAGLETVELPPSANLGDPARAADYARAAVEVAGRERGVNVARRGAPIVYGVSVRGSESSASRALGLLERLLTAEGRALLRRHGFEPLDPPWFDGDLPRRLRAAAAGDASE